LGGPLPAGKLTSIPWGAAEDGRAPTEELPSVNEWSFCSTETAAKELAGGVSLLLKDRFADALAGVSIKGGGAAYVVRDLFAKYLPDQSDLFQITRTPRANEQM
jgi:hypothetical protein